MYVSLYVYLSVYIDVVYMHTHHAYIDTYMYVICAFMSQHAHICACMAAYIQVYIDAYIYIIYIHTIHIVILYQLSNRD